MRDLVQVEVSGEPIGVSPLTYGVMRMRISINRILLTLLASLMAVAGLAGPSHAVTKLTDAQAASQLSAVGITRVSSCGCTYRSG